MMIRLCGVSVQLIDKLRRPTTGWPVVLKKGIHVSGQPMGGADDDEEAKVCTCMYT